MKFETEDFSAAEGFPEIGKWLLYPNLKPGNWKGARYKGKKMREPINVIFKDEKSSSPEDGINSIINELYKAGYQIRWGHFSGLYSLIDRKLYKQIPQKFFCAFSDDSWLKRNNHGRLFGPHLKDGTFYFTGAFSREKGFTHGFISFNKGRDDLIAKFDDGGKYKFVKYVNLDNKIENEAISTADHDGKAVLISTKIIE